MVEPLFPSGAVAVTQMLLIGAPLAVAVAVPEIVAPTCMAPLMPVVAVPAVMLSSVAPVGEEAPLYHWFA